LRLIAGYGIAEFPVHNMPDLENKPLRDCQLDERNIHVLHINRQSSVIPNPKGDEKVLPGDVLLCYGELKELRALMPESRKQSVRGQRRGAKRHTKRRGQNR
ncbi:MAG: TrkA C-terminal domain-containing protein, partial [Candidatus Sumerlaeota bacterium]